MLDLISSVFSTAQFIPHGMCLLWRPDLLILHGGSDLLIALAYFAIPLIILRAKERRPDLIDPAVARLFAAFITACALSHTCALLTIWYPAYGLQGFVKLVTAFVSIYTAYQLACLMPRFSNLPSLAELVRKDAQIIISERKMQEAQEAQERLSEFAHVASHDLKAPLRGIANQAKFIEMDHGEMLSPDAKKRLGRIGELCEQVDTLISTLMKYSSISTSATLTAVDVGKSVESIVSSLSEFLHDNNARVTIDPNLPAVKSDPAQIDTVFRNLIMNGVTYNTSETRIISIGYVKTALVNGQPIRDAYFVKDNGIGIKDEFRDAAFKMFKRLHAGTQYGPGSGSGLAFVKKVVSFTGGTVTFSSALGEGSTFYVSFSDQSEFETNETKDHRIEDGFLGATA